MEKQKAEVEQVLSEVRTVSEKVGKIPNKDDLNNSQNQTVKSLEQLHNTANKHAKESKDLLEDKFKNITKKIDAIHENSTNSRDKIGEKIDTLIINLANSHQGLTDEVRSLAKLEQVMVQTADGVMDTKRRVEYGVHQILLEIGDLVKVHSKEVNATINER